MFVFAQLLLPIRGALLLVSEGHSSQRILVCNAIEFLVKFQFNLEIFNIKLNLN